jgi:alpha-tubulin suppressor-like RCC1 family protein
MTHLSMSHQHALAVDRDGGLWAFGKGAHGRTGLGHDNPVTAFAGPSRAGVFRRDASASDADAVRASRAYAGDSHSVVLTRDGRLVGFGADGGGALLEDDPNPFDGTPFDGTLVPKFLAEPRREGCDDDDYAPRVVSAVACGGFGISEGYCRDNRLHDNACVAVSAEDGRVYAWGAPGPWLGTKWDPFLRGPLSVFE